jgi:uracil-DNA glycosylase
VSLLLDAPTYTDSERDRLRGTLCPVHREHRVAIIGEAPGPRTRSDLPFYPYPPASAAGRLLDMLGWDRRQYLLTFARMNLLAEYPGPSFPVARARECVPHAVEVMHPRPMLLMGRGVAAAFSLPQLPPLLTQTVTLRSGRDGPLVPCRVAMVPHPSGRNLWYNDPANRVAVRDFVNKLVGDLG